jgi:hypothetical protein
MDCESECKTHGVFWQPSLRTDCARFVKTGRMEMVDKTTPKHFWREFDAQRSRK